MNFKILMLHLASRPIVLLFWDITHILPVVFTFHIFHFQFFPQFLSINLFLLCRSLHLCLFRGGQEVVLRL